MPRKTILDVGTDVFAKWPGSQMYYPAKIIESYDNGDDSYKVQFESTDGEFVKILARYIRKPSEAKSWRSRSASPARSPARGKRRRSRSKSPTRSSQQRSSGRQRSPSRRQLKSKQESSSPKKEEEFKQDQSKSDEVDNAISTEEKETKVASKSVLHVTQAEERTDTIVVKRITRSLARIQQELIQQQAVEMKQSADAKEEKVKEEKLRQQGWSYQIMASMGIIVLPLCLMGLYFIFGDKKQGFSFRRWPVIPRAKALLNWKVFFAVECWYDVQCLLTRIPFGKIVTEKMANGKEMRTRLNGLLHLLIYVPVFGIGIYTKHAFKVASLVDENYLCIASSSIIAAFVTAVFFVIKAAVDKNSPDRSITPDNFLVGKEQYTAFLGFNIKWCLQRIASIAWVVLDVLFIVNHYDTVNGNVNVAAVFVAFCHVLYVTYTLIIEDAIVKSPAFQEMSIGFGLCLLTLSFMPLFYSLQVLYFVKVRPQPSQLLWAATIIFQCAGFYIFIKANLEKLEFRSDQKRVTKRDVKVVFTADGKNLLADGWWGRLRHPNYLGDILMAISWALPSGCSHIAPWLYPIFLTILLIVFAVEDDKRCAKKYGLSWDEYKSRVKYVIFPYVY